jgi:AAA domain
MALRGVKPKTIEKRLKALFYGAAGVGKTTCAIGFPKPYLIDTERGAENSKYVEILEKNGGSIFQTMDFDDLLIEIKSLLTEKHDYKTLIIDPLTNIYNDLLDKSAAQIKKTSRDKDADGTEFGRHYSLANKKMKHLLTLLLRLDMNVIITSHAKNEYGENMKVIKQTYDCYKKLDYLFDLVFEVVKRGPNREGVVRKSRIEGFEESMKPFPFCYEEIAKIYGKEILERNANQEILATLEQVEKVNHYIKLMSISEEIYQKWLDKAEAETFDEMKQQDIQKLINLLEEKIKLKKDAA